MCVCVCVCVSGRMILTFCVHNVQWSTVLKPTTNQDPTAVRKTTPKQTKKLKIFKQSKVSPFLVVFHAPLLLLLLLWLWLWLQLLLLLLLLFYVLPHEIFGGSSYTPPPIPPGFTPVNVTLDLLNIVYFVATTA